MEPWNLSEVKAQPELDLPRRPAEQAAEALFAEWRFARSLRLGKRILRIEAIVATGADITSSPGRVMQK